MKILKKIFISIMILPFVFAGFYFIYPDVSILVKENPGRTSFMKYKENQWEKEGKKVRIRQTWRPLNQMSPYLLKAVLISEDDKFWSHDGFDFEAMQKALEKDIKHKKIKFGGSTISQQLAKNLYLTPSKNPVRKLKEAIITWRIEQKLSKKRILELYLNVAEWGKGTFGAEAAAQYYFGKPASGLTADESARLAAALPNPWRYNPSSNSGYIMKRSGAIYKIMVSRKIVIEEFENDIAADGQELESVESAPEPPVEEPPTAVSTTASPSGDDAAAVPFPDHSAEEKEKQERNGE